MIRSFWLSVVLFACTFVSAAAADAGAFGRYRVLPAEPDGGEPFQVVDFTYGPRVDAGVAWQISIRGEEADQKPRMILRAITDRDPLADDAFPVAELPGGARPTISAKWTGARAGIDTDGPMQFLSYQLQIPSTGEVYDYRDVNTGKPRLPVWGDFQRFFLPHPAKGSRRDHGLPHTLHFLGHILTLREARAAGDWKPWDQVTRLDLDPELLIGTSRSFKDTEGKRLPQHPERQNYKYTPFLEEDYRVMIDAGINQYTVTPQQEPFVRGEPVFYLRGVADDMVGRYPADLYRSNYKGNVMFMDEPTCIMLGNKTINSTLKYFSDAAAIVTARVNARYLQPGRYGGLSLEHELRKQKITFGEMTLAYLDYPVWETVYPHAFYQLAGGTAGFVHEGRYQLGEFNEQMKASTGIDRPFTAEEMFKYYNAIMRGAARQFDKDWGMSIYGQADPAISPLAISTAYDMGARYIWFWTSDHDHHMPWPEQLELTRKLREHVKAHPRGTIRKAVTRDKAIVIPYGYFLVLESPGQRDQSWDLWWLREMDKDKQNASSRRYRRLMTNAFNEIIKALDAGEDFDIAVDDGREIRGYRKVMKVSDE